MIFKKGLRMIYKLKTVWSYEEKFLNENGWNPVFTLDDLVESVRKEHEEEVSYLRERSEAYRKSSWQYEEHVDALNKRLDQIITDNNNLREFIVNHGLEIPK